MALQKTPVSINFVKGLETKTDPYQVPIGSFLALKNSIFDVAGRLTKRFGFKTLTQLPNNEQTTITTYNDNLIATGSNLYALSPDTGEWLNRGTVQPVDLAAKSLVRTNASQSAQDAAISSEGLMVLVYMEASAAYYQVIDSTTGQQIVGRTALPATAIFPRAYVLGQYFIITFIATVLGSPHLQYIALPLMNPDQAGIATDISNSVGSTSSGYDGYLAINSNKLFLAWEGAGTTLKVAYLDVYLAVSGVFTLAAQSATLVSITADEPNSIIFVTYQQLAQGGRVIALDYALAQIMAATQFVVPASPRFAIVSTAANRSVTIFHEQTANYAAIAPLTRSDFIRKSIVTLPTSGVGTGTVTGNAVLYFNSGIGSKPFVAASGKIYFMLAYGYTGDSNPSLNSNQPTYFLADDSAGITMKLAYGNAGGYVTTQVVPSISLLEGKYYFPYLIRDFLTSINKGTSLPSGTPTAAIYTQTGISLAIFDVGTSGQHSSEIASALHLTGGQLWEYDGVKPVEEGFHLWPDKTQVTTSGTGGTITAQTYFYSFTYEWTDNQGRLHRSAPSIPVSVVTTGSTSSNTLVVSTLIQTLKNDPNNPVRIVGYRWSTAQQVYYQFTSLTAPNLNVFNASIIIFTDTLPDSAILGNPILYTTGGVLENIGAPACIDSALFKNRLFLIDAEDRNLLWYSKQVIEGTPVEMSDLLTLYVAPTTGTQGSTGDMAAISAMDDKLIIFKANAIYYLTGLGPDNTGANNDFTDPVFITASVGSDNPDSIALIPAGLMFKSNKGIWILGRDLSTNYIGAPVEAFNDLAVLSAETIPGTNQVRFILENNTTLMYDYFYNQWAVHTNKAAISATLYQAKHTYLNSYGQVFQENPGSYVDNSTPVLLSFTTSWISLAGLQGYERFYFGNLLGTYYSPFKLNVSLSYDYNSSAKQSILIEPDNFTEAWGDEANWGSGGPWGGVGSVFPARIFPEKQKCQTFQVTIEEVYDSSKGQPPGQGLALSGLGLIVGMKKGYRTQSARRSYG